MNLTVYPCTIAIVGGGLSGSLVAANLIQNATTPMSIKLIERHLEVGRGVAYSTQIKGHLLNVPAGKMSAFPDKPDHFLNWLHENGHVGIKASTFVPRQVYGDYVQATLSEAEANAPTDVSLERIVDEAIAIETKSQRVMVYLKGQCLNVQKAVLALGNFPASLPEPLASVDNHNRRIRDAWADDAIADLNPEDPILLIGTGLTMVDTVIALLSEGFQGKIHAVSRHGFMPLSHQPTTPFPIFIHPKTAPNTARELLHLVRHEVGAQGLAPLLAGDRQQDWRAVMDALRPVTQELWQILPLNEQKRFLRHLKAYWEVHRHRIAPEIAELLDAASLSGQLFHYAGRIQTCQESDHKLAVTIRDRETQANLVLQVTRIVNCTGSNCNYRKLTHPLISSLQEQRLIRPHASSMGIDTASNGALIDAEGNTSQLLYTIGTPRKGNLWETTAVPEIRLQAANLAQELLKSLHPKPYIVSDWFAPNPSSALPKPVMLFRQLFDKESSTYTYLIADPKTKVAILVDPVLEQVERDLQVIRELELTLHSCLETHIHADHITGAGKLKELTNCLSILPRYAETTSADRLIADGNTLRLGLIQIQAIATPGHTNSHMAYLVNGTHLLTGDALFIRGCGRTDFQNGDAGLLYDAVTQKLFTLPNDTLVYPAHDYQGRTVSTIGEEKRWNPRFAYSRSQFITFMNNLNLPYPQKMLLAVPANQHGGILVTLDYQI